MALEVEHLLAGTYSPQANALVAAAASEQLAVRGEGHGKDLALRGFQRFDLVSLGDTPNAERLVQAGGGQEPFVRRKGEGRDPVTVARHFADLFPGGDVPEDNAAI